MPPVVSEKLVNFLIEIHGAGIVLHRKKGCIVTRKCADKSFNIHSVQSGAGAVGKPGKCFQHEEILREIIGHNAFLKNLFESLVEIGASCFAAATYL